MTTEVSDPTEVKKKFRVGVPRALYFYKYFPFWEEMLVRLGCEIVVSPETNKTILKKGSEFASGELCVPIKIFFGHVLYLDEKYSDLDFIFVPRYVSLNKFHYFCPKFLSLPDVVRNVIKPKTPVLEWEMNAKEKSNIESAIELAKQLGINDQNMAGESYVQAINRFKAFKKDCLKGINYSELIYRKYPQYV
ncbi:MAG: hypothetical protein GY870_01325, partial [archaeon]|nr:hypothetical protein [archaeon]